MKITTSEYETQREYQALCDRARLVGVPTSLDDPDSPRTVEGLREAVEAAESVEYRGSGPDRYPK